MLESEFLEAAQRLSDAHARYLELREVRDEAVSQCDAAWRAYRRLTRELEEAYRERTMS